MRELIAAILGRSGKGASDRKAGGRPFGQDAFERFEPRTLLTTFTVLNLNDSGAGSLRQAIASANASGGADVIDFTGGLTGTLTLSTGELVVSEDVTIDGPGAGVLSINGNHTSRVIRFSGGTSFLEGLTIAGGSAFSGGGISNAGTLTLTDMVVSGNTATTAGGAGIDNTGTMAILNSTISGNDGGIGDGGGLANAGTMAISGSTISGNSAVNGGGIANFGAGLVVRNSTISGNTASFSGSSIINFNVMDISNSTIAGNSAATAISSSGTLTMVSSILAGTPGTAMGGTFAGGSVNNLIESSLNAGGLTNGNNGNLVGSNPLIGALANNGGSTLTHALLAGSPAIGAGSNPNALANDQRGAGFVRVRGGGIDIGAVEYNVPPVITLLEVNTSSINRGDSVLLTALGAADTDGSIARVDFYRDANNDGIADPGELIGTDSDSAGGYTFNFTNTTGIPAGTMVLLAVAVDDLGGASAPAGANVTVQNTLPTLVSVTPSSGSITRGNSLTLTANAPADSDGTISRVDFYRDANSDGIADAGELLGADSAGGDGYTFTFGATTGLALGSAQFLAVAVDNDGGRSVVRSTAVTVINAVPTVASLTSSAAAAIPGQIVTFTANTVADTDGTISEVFFYRDANGNGTVDGGDTLLGSDTNSAGGYTFALNTSGFPIGDSKFVAYAVDNDGGLSGTRALTLPIVHIFGAEANQLLGASAGPNGNLNVTFRNGVGGPIVLQEGAGVTTWTGSDLQAKTGSPNVVGEVVTWVDPKDGRNNAAAMTTDGLGLFTNTTGSTWTFRNLSNEFVGAPVITGNLTVFISVDNLVNLAGTAGNGDLIRWVQTGASTNSNYAWTATNLGDDLRAQSLAVPQFTGRITSFVTSWNALNVVGLDAAGQIQAIWWHQALNTGGKWTTNNLSAEYGAPALQGGLTVWLTSWNAINIAGTDTNGKLHATWWVPEYNNNQWNNDNLTDEFGGPLLQPDSMTSWVTSWGAMNIAGREADGTTSVYWWVPGYNNNQWQIAHFSEILPSATHTTGPVTGLTAPGGDFSMSILSTSEAGDVIRLWWSPTTNAWAEQNLTQTATPV